MKQSSQRILTTHTGSLPRPNALQHTVDPRIAWAKLQAMAEGAHIASQRLW